MDMVPTSMALERPMEFVAIGPRGKGAAAVSAETVDLAWMNARPEAWDRLVDEAGTAAPFYARAVVNAHVRHGLAAAPSFLVVRRGDRLLGLLPYRPAGAPFGWLARANLAWRSPYTTCSTPLAVADATGPVMAALLDGMAGMRGQIWLFQDLAFDDETSLALHAELARRAWPSETLVCQERPVFNRRPDGEASAGPGARRQKDLRRRLRRLAEHGAVRFASATAGEELRSAIDAFLAIEAAGWKGRRGTALASRPDTTAFARELFALDGGPVQARADLLLLDEKPIAASLALVCNRTAFLLKTAYDESFARHAPGVMLETQIVAALHETCFADRLNSAAAPGSILEQLYPDRERVGDLVLATSADFGRARLATLGAAETRRRRLKQRLGEFYSAWKNRRSTPASPLASTPAAPPASTPAAGRQSVEA